MNILKYKNHIRLSLLLLLVVLSLTPFCERVWNCLIHPERQNTTDMDIFASAGNHFIATGQLYQRSDNYRQSYAPGAGVYKFPPAYQLTIIPLLKLHIDNFTFLLIKRIIQLFLYFSATCILIISIGKQFIWKNHSINHASCRYKSYQFILISLLFTLWSIGFFESFAGLEPEITIFFLLSLAFLFSYHKSFIAGVILAIATAIKIYPAFVLLFFFFKKDKKAIVGFASGFVITTFFSIWYIGIDEHLFYLKNVLPVLLQEKPIYHVQNTTIEAMFNANNLINDMNGTITSICKILTILIICISGSGIQKSDRQTTMIFFGMVTAAILLFLANYWPQYQVFLVIPLLTLLAYSIANRRLPVFVFVIITAVAMSIQEHWFQDLKQQILQNGLQAAFDQIKQLSYKGEQRDIIFYFFPLLWILQRLRDWLFLSPAILFLLSAAILHGINKKNNFVTVTD